MMPLLRWNHLCAALCLLGCSRVIDTDDDIGDMTDESGPDADGESTTSDSDGSSSDATDADGSTSDSDASSTDSTDSTGDSTDSSDGQECLPEMIECPDGTCVYPFPEFGCCAYGGECAPGCEPQDADKGMGQCPGEPEYAWNGEACEEVCPCQGSDCDQVYASPIACIEAHPMCAGGGDFSQCPFDEPVSAISITGTVPGESVDLQSGAFGIFHGKGGGDQLMLRFAADELTLANHIAHPYGDPYQEGVLQLWSDPTVGVHDVTAIWGPPFAMEAPATLTILDLDIDNADPLAHFVTGTLEVMDGEWDLVGSFGIRHCNRLDQFAP